MNSVKNSFNLPAERRHYFLNSWSRKVAFVLVKLRTALGSKHPRCKERAQLATRSSNAAFSPRLQSRVDPRRDHAGPQESFWLSAGESGVLVAVSTARHYAAAPCCAEIAAAKM